MARFKRNGFRRISRYSMKRSARRSNGGMGGVVGTVLAAGLYGAMRGKLSQLAEPITSKVPLGTYADEALFGVAGWYLSKKGNGIMRNIGQSMLIVEAASVGNQLSSSMGTSVQSSGSYTYG